MVDAIFGDPRLAEIYDPLEPERPDLDAYLAVAEETGALSVLDIGCGTGTFACLLARAGKEVVGLDPAAASLAVARRKVGVELVRWIEGDVTALPPLQVDLVTMTGNVAQVFLSDKEWAALLHGARAALRPGGHLVFESRDPARRGWGVWNREDTRRSVELASAGVVETWTELTEVAPPLVSFRQTFFFAADRVVLASESTLRFRDRAEIERSLQATGFDAVEVRDAPDRPGLELVFICHLDEHASSAERARLTMGRTEVYRVDGLVVRAAGPWSASVHTLLRHLEMAGFPGARRVIGDGFDAAGNEVLSYIEGDFVHPQAWSDEGITGLGTLLRSFHDATAGFVPPDEAVWQPWFTRSESPDVIFGHGDLGPWNIVARRGLPVAFIDWEFAGPTDRLDEVAQVAWLNAQLHDDDVATRNQLPPPEVRAQQLGLFADAYGLDSAERAGLVTRMIDHAVRDAVNELTDPAGLKMAHIPAGPDDQEWQPVTPKTVIERINAEHHLDLSFGGRCPGGEVGAHYAMDADGARFVFRWFEEVADDDWRVKIPARIERLRTKAYPAPRYPPPVIIDGCVVLIQEWVPGSWSDFVDEQALDRVLVINRMQRGEGRGDRDWTDYIRWTLVEGADWYAVHDPLRWYGDETRHMLDHIESIGRGLGPLPEGDLVHFDLSHRWCRKPGPLPVSRGQAVCRAGPICRSGPVMLWR